MTENACQTSLENKQSQVANEEIQKLKEENFILQGKLRGYATLGNQILEIVFAMRSVWQSLFHIKFKIGAS